MMSETQTQKPENLQDMVNKIPTEDEIKPEDTELQVESETQSEEQPEPQPTEDTQEAAHDITVTNLTEWFEANHENFENINTIDVLVTGIDSFETLLFTVPHPKGGEDSSGNPKRRLAVVENANTQPVLNLPGLDFNVFPSGRALA